MQSRIVLCVLFMAGALLLAEALPAPRPAGTFSSNVVLVVSDHQHEETYMGSLLHNTPGRAQVVDIPSDSFSRLERWDLGRRYDLFWLGETCSVAKAQHSEEAQIWAWLSAAVWKGNYVIGGVVCQQWEYSMGTTHWAGCFNGDTPVAFAIAHSSTKVQYSFLSFTPGAPDPSNFIPPQFCSSFARDSFPVESQRQRLLRSVM